MEEKLPRLVLKKRAGRRRKVRPLEMEAAKNRMSPLEYMLAIMNDPTANPTRRDRMAIAAAPYVHAKLAIATLGKKDQQIEAAELAAVGTEWADDLDSEFRAN